MQSRLALALVAGLALIAVALAIGLFAVADGGYAISEPATPSQ